MNNVIELPLTFRSTDPKTSRQAPTRAKRMTQTYRLLGVYCLCSDLRALGWITPTGNSRPNRSGRNRIVCTITDTGRDAWMELQNG